MLSKRFALFAGIGALAGTASYASPARQLSGETLYPDGDPNTGSTTTHGCSLETSKIPCEGHGSGNECKWDTAENSCSAVSGESSGSESSGSSCTKGLPVVKWAVEIADIADANARTELCGDANVLCSTGAIVAKFDAGTTTLSYDDSDNWQVKSGDTVVLTSAGYKFNLIDYTLKDTTTVADTQLVDLVALNTQLDAGITVTNCDSTFQAAVAKYTALQVPCEEVGNTRKDLAGACATGTDACVVGYEYSTEDKKCKVKLTYVEPTTGDAATKAQDKRDHFKSIRKGGVVQRGSETEPEFKKRKFSQMKINTREYFKQKMLERVDANTDPNKKKHQMRKEERMPVSIAANSDDFKAAFIGKLRTKFGLVSGQDRDVGIIVGPDNSGAPEDCANWALADTFDDADKCITYDAAIDGDTTDVHVLGADGAYNVGGILVGDKYVPVVKQTLANANAETFDMRCWSGSAWEQQHKVEMGAEIYVKYVSESAPYYNFYTDVSCATGQIGKQIDGKYHLKPQQYTFHRCADDSGHPFDADLVKNAQGEYTGIAVGQTETLLVTSGDDFVWQCATHSNMNGIFTGAGWEAGDEVPCTVEKSGIVVKVDTIVGSSVTGQVDGDKCDEGYGCADTDDDGVCDTPLTCEPCASPEANNAVDATVCAAQLCAAGTGYDENKEFNPNLDPTNTVNANCHTCDDGTYNTGGNGQCVAYGTENVCNVANGYALDSSHDSKIADAPCVDVQSPTITSGAAATAIDENSARFQVVYLPTASENSGSVSFALRTYDDWENFEMDEWDSKVRFKLSPDFEEKSSYSFTVVAIDGAGNIAEQAVTLAINNVPDVACTKAVDCNNVGTASGFRDSTQGCSCDCDSANTGKQGTECKETYDNVAPQFTSADTASVAENKPLGTHVYTAHADEDVTFSLVDNASGKFSLSGSNVVTAGALDFESKESYTITLRATDANDNTANKDVTISVTNVDEVAPTITSASAATAINENSGAGQVVYTAQASDNSGGSVTFSLSGTDASAFTINSGEVTLTADPDFEAQSSYSFTVVATDGASNSASKTVTLTINNVDEVAPSITSGDTATSILETAAAGTTVYTATAADSGDVSATPITFSLGTNDASAFSIDSTGAVTLDVSQSPGSYSFTVTATDAAENSASKTVSLTVLPDADGDGTHDLTDPCVYTGCTVQQLTDAYALLTSADACSGSRRTHAHANVYGCKTAGCADKTGAIKTAFDTLHIQCPA